MPATTDAENTRVLVEQRIARGWNDQRIAADLAIDEDLAATYRKALDKINAEPGEQPCGTHAAYVRHRNRGEQPCPACFEADRAYHAARRAKARTAAA